MKIIYQILVIWVVNYDSCKKKIVFWNWIEMALPYNKNIIKNFQTKNWLPTNLLLNQYISKHKILSNKLLIEYIYYEFEKLKLGQTKNKTTPPPIINSAEPGVRNGDLYKFIKHINYIHDRIYIYIEKTNKVSQLFYTSTNSTLIHFFFFCF